MSGIQTGGSAAGGSGPRLDSWKEIAAYLRREVRTVQRWEKGEGLPVHRHLHDRAGTVYAFEAELDEWLAGRRPASPADPPIVSRAPGRRRTLLLAAAATAIGVGGLLGRPPSALTRGDSRIEAGTSSRPQTPSQVAGPADPEARRAELRGRYLWNRGGPRGFADSAREFEAVVAREPDYAPAWAGLASARSMLGRSGAAPPAETFPAARAAAEQALARDGSLAEAHTVLAEVLFYWDWDFPAAEAEFHRALALEPGSARAHHALAHFLSAMGRHDEAIAEARRAQQLEPLSATLGSDAGWFLFRARRWDEALAECRRALELEPGLFAAQVCVVDALERTGRVADAADELRRQAGSDAPVLSARLEGVAPADALRRWHAWRLERLESERASGEYVSPYGFAAAHAALGDTDAAFEALERAWRVRDRVVLLLAVHPSFDPLRDDPRLDELIRRVGLVPPVGVARR